MTIDGSCNYINGLVKDGTFAADSGQYPDKMGAIASIARGGPKPTLPPGQRFIDSGTALVTADPMPGVPGESPGQVAQACWG